MNTQRISYKIRTANKKDAIDCIYLSKTSWSGWWSRNEKLGTKYIKDCINGKMCLVVLINHEIIAILVWGTFWNKIHFQDIFVKDKYRRIGLATRLLKKATEIAKKQGFKEIMSDCDASNKIAISFHLRNGFKKCGYIKNYWDNENSYVFSKKI